MGFKMHRGFTRRDDKDHDAQHLVVVTDPAYPLDMTASLTASEGATKADASAGLPAQVKVVAGYDGANVRTLKTDAAGQLVTTATFNEAATKADGAAGVPALVKVMAGYDGANVRTLKTDASGQLMTSGTFTEVATKADGAVGLPALVKIVAGFDGSAVQAIATDAAGVLQTDVLNTVSVDDAGASLTVDSPQLPSALGANGALKVEGVASGTPQPVSASSLPLPTGAATAAKQPALGSAGSASADVLTVQGVAGMTAVKVDGSASTQPVSGTVAANVTPAASGGCSVYRALAAASNNAANIKNAAGQVYGWYIFNAAAATRYVKLYNKASAPTPASDTPFLTIPIPAGSAANVEFTTGIAFGTGIGIAIVGGIGDTDNTAVTANDVVVNLLYK